VLVIFDNDGTICDTQEVEGRCYALAIRRVTGFCLSTTDWSAYDEPTSSAIVRSLLAGAPDALHKENQIKIEFCRLLREEQPLFPGDFSPIPGAIEFIERLRLAGMPVAIATGGFDSEARFKLDCCGIAMDAFPHATSSDVCRRSDIITLAASRAGHDLASAVYFGDAPWDVRVCAKLGIPMIGIGRRHRQLRSLGIPHAFRDYSDPERILDALHVLGSGHRVSDEELAAAPGRRRRYEEREHNQ
jgi:beta-phosphoglucomutase-like phosphatase (HAD superfamily)